MVESGYKYIDLSYMDLMADGDVEMKKTMLGMLIDELPSEIEKMVGLSEASDWGNLKSVSHKLKSTLAFVGNETLTISNNEVEKISKDEVGIEQIPSFIQKLTHQSGLALIELRSEFDKL